jgi:hypothetical protein
MRIYLALIAILVVLTMAMAAPGAGVMFTLITLGAGLPLVFSGTLLLYALCALPLVALWSFGTIARVGAAVVVAALVAAAAFAPRAYGRFEAETQAQALRTADHVPASPVAAATIEIRRPSQSYDGTFADADQEACGEECRGVLLGGGVRWVRVVMIDGSRHQETSTFHRALHGADCAVPGGTISDSAACVVMAVDSHEAPELTIAFETPPKVEASAALFAVLKGSRAVVARRFQGGQEEEALRQTEVMFETPIAPTLLGPIFQGMDSHGFDMLRESKRINRITLKAVLEHLGYALAPPSASSSINRGPNDWRRSIDNGMTREMVAVLDLPQSEPFNPERMKPVFNWIAHARMVKDWTPDLIALLRRIVHDPRIRAPTFFDQIFERNPDVAKALMPDVLDVIGATGIGRDYTPSRQAAYTFARLDPDLLKPYADRIVALLDHGRDVKAILLPATGRLGVDPAPYLIPIDADQIDPSPYSPDPRLHGVCRAEIRWAPELIGPLRQSFLNPPGGTTNDVNYLEQVLGALDHLGDHAFVEQQLASDARINAALLRMKAPKGQVPSRWACKTY